ncbi:MAG: leucine efflux protein LeuE [Pseudomonadota bacterium]|jgi:leucine efflux protein
MSVYGVTDLSTYVMGAIGIILLPGPNSLYVLSVATVRGIREGFRSAGGVFVGDAILLLLVALGAAGLLHTQPALFAVVKYAGAAYLVWVGLGLLMAAGRRFRIGSVSIEDAAPVAPNNLQQPFRRALVISLLNPKAIVFLLSFFVQFIDPAYPNPAVPFLILAALLMAFSGIYLSVLIVAGAQMASGFRRRQRLSAALSGAVGALFIWFGAKLATASLG